jgi:hypothetical protein
MAITLVGTNSGNAANGNDVTISIPGGTVENDIVLVMGGHGNTAGDAGVSSGGYTEVIDRDRAGCQLSVSWRRMPFSVPGTVTCNGSGNANDATAYVVMVFRGVDTTTALDTTSTSDEGTNSTPNSPLITTNRDSAAVISCFIHASNETSITAPAGYINKIDATRTETNPVTVGAAWDSIPFAGGENPGGWNGLSSAAWVAATIALKPAAVGTVEDAVAAFAGGVTASFVNGTLSVLRATGTGTATLKGNALKSSPFSITGTWTQNFVGTGASPNPAPFSMTGTGTASFVGALQGGGGLSALATANVNFVGDFPVDATFASVLTGSAMFIGARDRQKHVREVIESKGAAGVTIRV